MLSSAGVAPLPPGFHKLLSETVTMFAVFPSWMYLLYGDDNCMLSVPFSTSHLTTAVGRVAQIATRWLPKLSCCSTAHCGFLPKADDLLFVLSCCLANLTPAPRFPSSRPDTASFRSCLLLPQGFLGTREAGICAGSRALSPFLSPRLVLHVMARARWSQAACE